MSDHQVVLRRLRALDRRMRRATTALDACERERSELYQEARALDPPLTFKQIADVFGITQAAVMQKLARSNESAPKRKRKPKAKLQQSLPAGTDAA